jgi:VCBS repeat-containing protein
MSRDQSGMRARNALIAFLRGDSVYWEGGFDENQIEQVEQFTIPVDDQGNVGNPEIYNQERESFLNTISMSNNYESIAGGQLPEGVQTKGFVSADGHWYFSIAVYSQSAQAIAQGTAIENNNAINAIDKTPSVITTQPSNNSTTMAIDGGVSEDGYNPEGPSGQVSDGNDF